MNTSDFLYYRCTFGTFNKVQSVVVPFLDKDVNLVISLETSTGKTLLAECAFSFHLTTDSVSKVVYVSPYRSLTAEKYNAWKINKQLSQFGLVISTGDYVSEDIDYEIGRVLLLTSEALDFKIRNPKNWGWIKKVSCFVFDEAHLLGQPVRGSNMEVAVMNVARLNPLARIIFLSATMSNAVELAKWLKSLNNKETKCIKSNWRPVENEVFYHSYDDSERRKEEDNKLEKVVEVVKQKHRSGEKTIIFVHSKNFGKIIVKTLQRNGIVSAFHNASLPKSRREKIEKFFNSPFSGLDIIVSTSTLATGVNLGE